jgi:hypothetical protein
MPEGIVTGMKVTKPLAYQRPERVQGKQRARKSRIREERYFSKRAAGKPYMGSLD